MLLLCVRGSLCLLYPVVFHAIYTHLRRLVGRDHTVAVWDSDPRNCVQQNSRLYSPANLHDTVDFSQKNLFSHLVAIKPTPC